MKIGYWYLRRRREEELLILQPVHVLLELRQLRCADHAFAPDEKRRTYFEIAVVARVEIKHELDQRSFQSRPGPGETDKSAPAQFCGAFQIEKLQLRSKRDVILSLLQLRLLAPTPDDRIFARIFSNRRRFGRQIRNPEKQLSLLLVEPRRLLVQRGNLIPDLPHPRFDFFRRFPFRALAADLLAQSLSIRVALLQRRFGLPPLRVNPQNFIDLRRIFAPTRRQPAFHKVGLFADKSDIEHGRRKQTGLTGLTRLKPLQSRKSC